MFVFITLPKFVSILNSVHIYHRLQKEYEDMLDIHIENIRRCNKNRYTLVSEVIYIYLELVGWVAGRRVV